MCMLLNETRNRFILYFESQQRSIQTQIYHSMTANLVSESLSITTLRDMDSDHETYSPTLTTRSRSKT